MKSFFPCIEASIYLPKNVGQTKSNTMTKQKLLKNGKKKVIRNDGRLLLVEGIHELSGLQNRGGEK